MTTQLFLSFWDSGQFRWTLCTYAVSSMSNNVLLSQQWHFWAKGYAYFFRLLQRIVKLFLMCYPHPQSTETPVPTAMCDGHRHSGGREKVGRGAFSLARSGGNTWKFEYISRPVCCQLSPLFFFSNTAVTTTNYWLFTLCFTLYRGIIHLHLKRTLLVGWFYQSPFYKWGNWGLES